MRPLEKLRRVNTRFARAARRRKRQSVASSSPYPALFTRVETIHSRGARHPAAGATARRGLRPRATRPRRANRRTGLAKGVKIGETLFANGVPSGQSKSRTTHELALRWERPPRSECQAEAYFSPSGWPQGECRDNDLTRSRMNAYKRIGGRFDDASPGDTTRSTRRHGAKMSKSFNHYVKRFFAARGIYIQKLGFTYYQGDASEGMEYSLIKSIISSDWPRIIVDVGANNGYSGSNSYNFIKDGWRGVLVEPNPSHKEAINNYLRGCDFKLEQVAVSNKEGTAALRFDRHPNALQKSASITTHENDWVSKNISDTSIEVGTRRLETILLENEVPKDFGILSVDVEGHELEVISSIGDWRPRVIITEAYAFDVDSYREKCLWLVSNGYLPLAQLGVNEVYIHQHYFKPGTYNFIGRHI